MKGFINRLTDFSFNRKIGQSFNKKINKIYNMNINLQHTFIDDNFS